MKFNRIEFVPRKPKDYRNSLKEKLTPIQFSELEHGEIFCWAEETFSLKVSPYLLGRQCDNFFVKISDQRVVVVFIDQDYSLYFCASGSAPQVFPNSDILVQRFNPPSEINLTFSLIKQNLIDTYLDAY